MMPRLPLKQLNLLPGTSNDDSGSSDALDALEAANATSSHSDVATNDTEVTRNDLSETQNDGASTSNSQPPSIEPLNLVGDVVRRIINSARESHSLVTSIASATTTGAAARLNDSIPNSVSSTSTATFPNNANRTSSTNTSRASTNIIRISGMTNTNGLSSVDSSGNSIAINPDDPDEIVRPKSALIRIMTRYENETCHPIFLLNKNRVTIGRLSTCDFILFNIEISREHAEVNWANLGGMGLGYYISNLNSTNGTYANGTKLLPGHSIKLRDGMIISFGSMHQTSYVFLYVENYDQYYDSLRINAHLAPPSFNGFVDNQNDLFRLLRGRTLTFLDSSTQPLASQPSSLSTTSSVTISSTSYSTASSTSTITMATRTSAPTVTPTARSPSPSLVPRKPQSEITFLQSSSKKSRNLALLTMLSKGNSYNCEQAEIISILGNRCLELERYKKLYDDLINTSKKRKIEETTDMNEDENEEDDYGSNDQSKVPKIEKEDVLSHLVCAICSEYFVEAEAFLCGHAFCFYCAENWIRTRGLESTCPVCRHPITSRLTIPILNKVIEHCLLTKPNGEKSLQEWLEIYNKRETDSRRFREENDKGFIGQPVGTTRRTFEDIYIANLAYYARSPGLGFFPRRTDQLTNSRPSTIPIISQSTIVTPSIARAPVAAAAATVAAVPALVPVPVSTPAPPISEQPTPITEVSILERRRRRNLTVAARARRARQYQRARRARNN